MTLLESLKTYNYKKDNESYFITIDGYDFFYCHIKGMFKDKEALAVALNKHLDIASFKVLKKSFVDGTLMMDSIAFKDDILIIMLNDNSNLTSKLNNLVKLLIDLDLKDKDTCFMCAGKASKLSFDGLYVACHESCLARYKKEDHQDHFIKGFIYSCIGSLIGIVVLALLYIFTNNYVVMLTFLVPVFSAIGFYFSKASRSYKSDLFMYLFSFISVFIFSAIYIAIDINNSSLANDLASYIANYKQHFELIIIQSITFYALGVVSSLLFLKNQNVSIKKRIK